MRAASRNLCDRLRIVAGQCVVKPPAIDIEAADHIERLEGELASLQRKKADVVAHTARGELLKEIRVGIRRIVKLAEEDKNFTIAVAAKSLIERGTT